MPRDATIDRVLEAPSDVPLRPSDGVDGLTTSRRANVSGSAGIAIGQPSAFRRPSGINYELGFDAGFTSSCSRPASIDILDDSGTVLSFRVTGNPNELFVVLVGGTGRLPAPITVPGCYGAWELGLPTGLLVVPQTLRTASCRKRMGMTRCARNAPGHSAAVTVLFGSTPPENQRGRRLHRPAHGLDRTPRSRVRVQPAMFPPACGCGCASTFAFF